MRRGSGRYLRHGRAAVAAVAVLAASLAGLTLASTQAQAATSPGAAPGTVAHPIGRVHLEEFEWFNLLQVVDASNRIVRTIKVAGNPTISKPDVCYTAGRIRVNYDYTYQWRLNYFTRLCPGRGLGTHAIPLGRTSGLPDMSAADLGKPPYRGAPLSHGCLRMTTADAEYVYDNFSGGTPIYFVRTPWRPLAPGAPEVVRATPGPASLTVTWSGADLRGVAVSSYAITVAGHSYAAVATARSIVVSGLPAGAPLRVSVVAHSSLGSSAAGVSPAVAPYGLSGVPAPVQGPPGFQHR